MSAPRDSPAKRAIGRYFREPPPLTPDDLGLVIHHRGRDVFLPARSIVEITPALSCSMLPGAPGIGISFWRGRALEVRGIGPVPESFVLIRGEEKDFFLVSETLPKAISQALAGTVEPYREET